MTTKDLEETFLAVNLGNRTLANASLASNCLLTMENLVRPHGGPK